MLFWNGMLIALAIGFCAACRSASALLSVAAGVASGPVQFNVRTLISMIITIHPSNAIVPMTRTAASQRNLTSGTLSWLAGSERGKGADTGEANGLPGWRLCAISFIGMALQPDN